jgi:hypothetical protein
MLSQMHIGLDVKHRLFSSDFNETSIFATDFSKKIAQMLNFMKIHPVGAELFGGGTDGQIDVMKLIVAFRNFAKAPNNNNHRI